MMLAVGMPLLLRMVEAAAIRAEMPSDTVRKLNRVDEALIAFVGTQRRLPCPADGSQASGAVGVGNELRDANGDCTAMNTGVVPWASLGLAEPDIIDAWGGRITYRVSTGSTGMTRNNALDLTFCDPSGLSPSVTPATTNTAVSCPSTCVRLPAGTLDYLTCAAPQLLISNRGLTVRDSSGAAIRDPAAQTGAAYVLVAHGAEGGGAFTNAGSLTSSSVSAGANGEIRNQNNHGIPVLGYFHDLAIRAGQDAGADHFDDALSYPMISDVLTRTGLGARVH